MRALVGTIYTPRKRSDRAIFSSNQRLTTKDFPADVGADALTQLAFSIEVQSSRWNGLPLSSFWLDRGIASSMRRRITSSRRGPGAESHASSTLLVLLRADAS